MTEGRRIGRRRFLILTGSVLGAGLLSCAGIANWGLRANTEYSSANCKEGENMGERILIAYATKCGSTIGVAEAIGQVLCEAGAAVDVLPAREVKDLSPYGAVVIGSAARMGRILGDAVKLAKRHRQELADIPTAYFTVCLAVTDSKPENRDAANGYLAPLREVKTPVSEAIFAGAIDYEKLEPLLRMVMSKSKPMPEGDFRQWEAIREWAHEIAPALMGA
jgi:menaquinone-dependent protoporphyrinogen oxidase